MNQQLKPIAVVAALLWAALIALPGCRTADRSVVTPVDLPADFSQTGKAPLPEKWWNIFDDPGVDAAIDQAMRDNFSLRTAWDRLNQARASATSAGANLLPNVEGSGGAGRSVEHIADQQTTYQNNFALGLTVNYEVDLWGRIRSTHDAAVLDTKATEQDLHAAAITLSASVADTWYRWAEAQALVRLIEEQVATNQKVHDLLALQFKQGQAAAADVLRQRQLVQQTQGQLILAQSTEITTHHELALLLGQVPKRDLNLPPATLVALPELPATGLSSELLTRRPDLISAADTVRAADKRLAAAIADQYPRVSLSASVETNAADVRDLFDNWLANLAGNFIQPLFDGNLRKAEVARNRAVVSEALNAYGSSILDALNEVESALTQESHQQQYIDSLQQQLDSAVDVVERTKDRYLNGQLEYINVLEALVSQQALQKEMITARRTLLTYRIELCRALAGSWELPVPQPRAVATDSPSRDNTSPTP